MNPPYPHLIRQTASIDHSEYVRLGVKGVKDLMRQVEDKAWAMAKQVGITRVKVRWKTWDLDVLCGFTEYPMYLCGPGAPKIRTAGDVFAHVWHIENPRAKYEVALEDQDLFEQKEDEWMDLLNRRAKRGLAR